MGEQELKPVLENGAFSLVLRKEKDKSVYHFRMNPQAKASQDELNLLTQSLSLICNSTTEKHSVILDCSSLAAGDVVRKFLELDIFDASKGIGNAGLDKFVIVTQVKAVQKVSKLVIALKKASHYTKVCKSLEAALFEISG